LEEARRVDAKNDLDASLLVKAPCIAPVLRGIADALPSLLPQVGNVPGNLVERVQVGTLVVSTIAGYKAISERFANTGKPGIVPDRVPAALVMAYRETRAVPSLWQYLRGKLLISLCGEMGAIGGCLPRTWVGRRIGPQVGSLGPVLGGIVKAIWKDSNDADQDSFMVYWTKALTDLGERDIKAGTQYLGSLASFVGLDSVKKALDAASESERVKLGNLATVYGHHASLEEKAVLLTEEIAKVFDQYLKVTYSIERLQAQLRGAADAPPETPRLDVMLPGNLTPGPGASAGFLAFDKEVLEDTVPAHDPTRDLASALKLSGQIGPGQVWGVSYASALGTGNCIEELVESAEENEAEKHAILLWRAFMHGVVELRPMSAWTRGIVGRTEPIDGLIHEVVLNGSDAQVLGCTKTGLGFVPAAELADHGQTPGQQIKSAWAELKRRLAAATTAADSTEEKDLGRLAWFAKQQLVAPGNNAPAWFLLLTRGRAVPTHAPDDVIPGRTLLLSSTSGGDVREYAMIRVVGTENRAAISRVLEAADAGKLTQVAEWSSTGDGTVELREDRCLGGGTILAATRRDQKTTHVVSVDMARLRGVADFVPPSSTIHSAC
jgi:hypothetical protein